MKRVTAYLSLFVLTAALAPAFAQRTGPLPQDEVVWELATWPGVDVLGNPQTQATSGEDWAYSIAQSRTAAGVLDGYVAAGYSTYPATGGGVSDGCQRPCNDEFGCTYGTLTKIASGGEVEWVVSDYSAVYWKVINTSDGGFLAVGHTTDRNLFPYNPTAPGVGTSLICWPNNAPFELRSRSLIIAVKYDHDGTEQWKYSYGEMDNPNDHVWSLGSLQTQTRQDIPWDVVERPDGGFRIVACAVDPDIGMNPRAFAVDIAANGVVQNRQVYGQGGVASDPSTWRRSMLMGIARWGNEYVAVGTQYTDTLEVGTGDVMVIKLGSTLTTQPLAQATLTNTPNEQDTGFNVAFAGDGSVHVASVLDCENFGECRRFGAGGEGDLIVHRLRRSDLAVLGSTGSALGRVKGFDILVGLTSTADGGTALVSTKQPNGPTGQGSPTDNTDAFVAKLTTTAAVDWTKTYDARTNRIHTETGSNYEKHQECLYDIIEDGEGGLVIAGNNSSNLDDNYVVRLGTAEPKTLPATTVWNSHLVYPSAPQSFTATLSGDLEATSSGEIWVDPDRTLKFPAGARLVADGIVQTDGARLAEAAIGQGWKGVAVAGSFESDGGTVVEDADVGVTVYDPGTATITNSTLRDNTVGLDVLSDAGTTVSESVIENNGTGLRSGVPQTGPGAPVPCFTTCRSALSLFDSSVSDNDDNGVYAISVDADIRFTEMSGNGQSGLRVADADIFPFNNNVLEANGQNGLSFGGFGSYDGISVLTGGDLQMMSTAPVDPYGVNRVINSVGRELSVASGGTAFVGTHRLSGTPDDGRNTIYDATYGGALIANNSGATLYAGNTFWNATAPPAGAFTGGLVKANPPSDCDYTVSPPACISTSRTTGSGDKASGNGDKAGSESSARGGEWLRTQILATRAALAADPASGEAPGLVRTLAALHRYDRDDATGERVASWALLRGLRVRLNGEGGVPPALRPAVEAALEAEAVERLTRGERQRARTLVALAPLAEDGGVRRVLALVEAHLEAAEGRYSEAAALVEAVAAAEDPEGGMEGVLLDLAAVFAERAGGGASGARGTGAGTLAHADAGGAPTGVLRDGLAVYPNPSATSATVALTLTASSGVRVAVYDMLGRRVASLADGELPAGTHRLAFDAGDLPAGVYLVRAESGRRTFTRRITLVR